LNVTLVAPVKLAPLIVTLVPAGPEVGANVQTVGPVGAEETVNSDGLVATPPRVVTVMGPVEAQEGTLAEMVESSTTLNVAAAPLKDTVVAPVR
jgi:hypothetical protein